MDLVETAYDGGSIVSVLFVAFAVWMVVDAVRRRAEFYWLLIIVLFWPLGSIIYFFAVKLRDMRKQAVPDVSERVPGRPSLISWRPGNPFAMTPVELATADALESAERYEEAIERYEHVLERQPRNHQALHGLARCMLGTGKPERAVELLGELLAEDNAYRNYSAALEYAEALWQAGQREDCLQVLEQLVAVTRRINHRVALAHYSLAAELPSRAREVLEQALADHARQPERLRRHDQPWADRATVMLASLQPVS